MGREGGKGPPGSCLHPTDMKSWIKPWWAMMSVVERGGVSSEGWITVGKGHNQFGQTVGDQTGGRRGTTATVFLGLSVLDLGPMYETDRRQTRIIA